MSTRLDFAAINIALSSRLLTVSALPTVAPSNVDAVPPIGAPFVREAFAPGTVGVTTFGPNPKIVARGVYKILIYGVQGQDVTPNNTIATAIVSKFGGWVTALTNGDTLRIRTDLFPVAGGSYNDGAGFWVTPVNVYWQCESQMTIGA